MEPDFWRARWSEGRIGFHQAQINPHLMAFRGRLHGGRPGRVLVPLCGKSQDMAWLMAQGDQVVGVELVESAVQAFFTESGVSATREPLPSGATYRAPGCDVHAADFFALSADQIGPIEWVYDRAALIAFPPAMRSRYAARILELLAPGAQILLVTLEYDENKLEGPPFAVLGPEVERLYGPQCKLERLTSADASQSPRFRETGVAASEVVWLMEKR